MLVPTISSWLQIAELALLIVPRPNIAADPKVKMIDVFLIIGDVTENRIVKTDQMNHPLVRKGFANQDSSNVITKIVP